MEAAGLALAVLPLCAGGFHIVDMIKSSNKGMRLVLTRWEIQRDRFEDWSEIWQDNGLTIHKYARESPRSAQRILKHLLLLSQTFFDLDRLQKRFGLKLTKGDQEPRLGIVRYRRSSGGGSHARDGDGDEEEDLGKQDVSDFEFKFKQGLDMEPTRVDAFKRRCEVNLTLLQKCKFVLGGRKALDGFIDVLKEYNDILRDFSPKRELAKITRGFDHLSSLLHEQLLERADAAEYEAQHAEVDTERQRYHDLALAARFLDALRRGRDDPVPWHNRSNFIVVYDTLGVADTSLFSVGVMRSRGCVVLIEWLDPAAVATREAVAKAERTARMLQTEHPRRLLLPDCYGIVEEPSSGQVGFVLTTPKHISELPREADLRDRTGFRMVRGPITLRNLIKGMHESYDRNVDLGKRFLLAQKLVGAVRLMHAVGWVHKNIRSQRIILFPEPDSVARSARRGDGQRLMFEEPQLIGFSYAHSANGNTRQIQESATELQRRDSADAELIARNPRSHARVCLDLYRHPHSLEDPSAEFLRFYDWYSLGCVLLEIGRWQTLDDCLFRGNVLPPPRIAMRRIQELAAPEKLDNITGSIYGDVVRKCLDVGTHDTMTKEAQSRLETDIEAYIGRCTA
ncbi:hypothetical protein B0T14DRAFT_531985 [Immersiella caudata]|uniref:Protein kinase domain-containing protein n=1 Tax=Immersiella caudata TaxID=314043 RepID=A0AA39T0I5_9PEZI|nr:hypothetical protein B0T14DRAFT_531985 [Immersiella caudata]